MDNAIYGSAKAWVNFNGTGTVAIRASYNVSSVTRASTGIFTINFTTAFTDANYSTSGMTGGTTGTGALRNGDDVTARTTSAVTVISLNSGGSAAADSAVITVSAFR